MEVAFPAVKGVSFPRYDWVLFHHFGGYDVSLQAFLQKNRNKMKMKLKNLTENGK